MCRPSGYKLSIYRLFIMNRINGVHVLAKGVRLECGRPWVRSKDYKMC
jgi:hypothetical protein